jgi:hypothetical protein
MAHQYQTTNEPETNMSTAENGGLLRLLLKVYVKGVELSASQDAGLLELWQGAGQVVCITHVGTIYALEVKSCEQCLLQFLASNSNRQKGNEWSPTES